MKLISDIARVAGVRDLTYVLIFEKRFSKMVARKIVGGEKELRSVVTKPDVRHWVEGNAMDAGSRGITGERTKDALKGEEEDSRRGPRLASFPFPDGWQRGISAHLFLPCGRLGGYIRLALPPLRPIPYTVLSISHAPLPISSRCSWWCTRCSSRILRKPTPTGATKQKDPRFVLVSSLAHDIPTLDPRDRSCSQPVGTLPAQKS